MRGKSSNFLNRSSYYIAVVALIVSTFGFTTTAWASVISSASNSMSTIRESQLANHTIQFITPAGIAAGQTVAITFPVGFTMGTFAVTNVDFAVSSGGTCTGFTDRTLAASAAGATWGIAQAAQTITLTSGTDTVTAGRCLLFRIGANATFGGAGVNQITNQTVAQNNADPMIVIGGTFGNTGLIAVEIVSDDDVLITATIISRITCGFTGMASNFPSMDGTIQTGSATTTITVSTNAQSGFSVTVRGVGNAINPGLNKSIGTPYLIGSADSSFADTATLAQDVDGFGVQAATSGGIGAAVTVAARYNQTGNVVGGLELVDTLLASAPGPVSNRAMTMTYRAAVSGLAPAGSYSDTLTYICVGVF